MRELAPAWPPIADGVERHRVEALRRAVHRGREPGRAGADHDEIEQVPGRGAEREAQVLGELARASDAATPRSAS